MTEFNYTFRNWNEEILSGCRKHRTESSGFDWLYVDDNDPKLVNSIFMQEYFFCYQFFRGF